MLKVNVKTKFCNHTVACIFLPSRYSRKRKCYGKNKGDDIPEIHIVTSVK